MFCTACANVNPLSAGRCLACGAGLPGVERFTSNQPTVAESGALGQSRRRRAGRWMRSTLGVILPIALLLAAGGYWRADQSARAAAYARAEAALAANDYQAAIEAFGAAGTYRDAETRQERAEATLAPYEANYFDAVAAMATGDDATAIALLVPIVADLPNFRDAEALLIEARDRRERALYRAVDAAEDQRDWLAVERGLAELVAANPSDAALWSRLETVRREHAPLVYSRDGALYLIGPSGEDSRLLFESFRATWPVWSPDRTHIAFYSPDRSTTGNPVSLYVLSLVDPEAAPRRLATQARSYAAPVWSPDGSQIAFVSQAPLENRADPSPRTVRLVHLATGVVTDLTGDRLPNAASPSWSPDGTRLAVVSRQDDGIPGAGLLASGEVYVITLATGAIESVGQGRVTGPWRLAWSPTTEAVIVATRSAGMSYDSDRSSLYLIDTQTGAMRDLNPRGDKVSMPVWSPDGSRYAYVVNDTTVRVQSLGGIETWTTLERAMNGALTWSPGGEALFALGPPGGASYRIPLGERLGQEVAIAVAFDPDTRQAGTPQWGAVNPAPPPAPATTAGTALDTKTPRTSTSSVDVVVVRAQ